MEFFIHGAWSSSDNTERIDITNPATGAKVDSVPTGTPADVDRVLASAQGAFGTWRQVSMAARAKLQHAAAQRLRERAGEFARLLTLELGRPLAGSSAEIERSANLLDYFAEEGMRLRGELPSINEPNERVLVVRDPVGVVVAITPFNYPLTLLTFKLGAALIAGCTVVAKPASETPLTTLKLAELFNDVGYPPGTFNVITGRSSEIGRVLVEHPIPRKIAFTGSTAAGKRILAMAAGTNKRVTLEMGGQSPAILCEDADLATAVPALVNHAFANSGQFCYRVNRVYVQRAIYTKFLERFADAAAKLTVGNGDTSGCDLGPMINEKIYSTSVAHVDDAVNKGGRVLTGGLRLTGGDYDRGFFFPATLIADTNHQMKIMTEETFGPVIGVMPFDSLSVAIDLANDSPYGLAAYVFSQNLAVGWRTAEKLKAGSVWVNDIHRSYNMVPFGGFKESGQGREKSRHGLYEYLELKTIYLSMDL